MGIFKKKNKSTENSSINRQQNNSETHYTVEDFKSLNSGNLAAQLGKSIMSTLFDADRCLDDNSSSELNPEQKDELRKVLFGDNKKDPFDENNEEMSPETMISALGIKSRSMIDELSFFFQLKDQEGLLILDWKDVIAECEYILSKDDLKIPFDKRNIKELHRQASLADARNTPFGLKAQYPLEAQKISLIAYEKGVVLDTWEKINEFLNPINLLVSEIKKNHIDSDVYEYIKACVLDIVRDKERKNMPVDECWLVPEDGTTKSDEKIITGEDFERYCANLLVKNGYINVELTPGSGDHGVDILAEKDSITYAIQCKYYSSPVGNSAIQEAFSGKQIYKRDMAVVMTNNTFTKQAIDDAQSLGVKLWDGSYLAHLKA